MLIWYILKKQKGEDSDCPPQILVDRKPISPIERALQIIQLMSKKEVNKIDFFCLTLIFNFFIIYSISTLRTSLQHVRHQIVCCLTYSHRYVYNNQLLKNGKSVQLNQNLYNI